MINSIINLKASLLFVIVSLAMVSCIKDPVVTPPNFDTARARIEITDAPIDDPNVAGVFVTIVDIKVNGQSWSGFDGKTTFDLLKNYK